MLLIIQQILLIIGFFGSISSIVQLALYIRDRHREKQKNK